MNLATIVNDEVLFDRTVINGLGNLEGLINIILLMVGIVLIASIINIITSWKLFTKAGEKGWKSIIPIYNIFIMIKIAFGEGKGWLLGILVSLQVLSYGINSGILSTLISLALIGLSIYISFGFYRRYASDGMAIGAILLPFIFGIIIAFGDYYYTPIKGSTSIDKGDDSYEY